MTNTIFIYGKEWILDTREQVDGTFETLMYSKDYLQEEMECVISYNELAAEFTHKKILNKYKNIIIENAKKSIAKNYINNFEVYASKFIA